MKPAPPVTRMRGEDMVELRKLDGGWEVGKDGVSLTGRIPRGYFTAEVASFRQRRISSACWAAKL